MVQINEREWDMDRLDKVRFELTQFDKDICQADTAKHIVIPMNDVINLRRVAHLLQTFGHDLDLLTRRRDYTARTIILETRALINGLNAEIRDTIGKGKRRKPLQDNDN